MNTNTVKDEEGVKVMKPKFDELKTQIETIIKKITKKQKVIDTMERDIYGIPDKEIKENTKKTDPKRFRNPDPALLALAELHKYDTAKYLKDDKTVKLSKTWFSKQHKKRLAEIKKARENEAKGLLDSARAE